MAKLPPARHFAYVLGTVNVIMVAMLVLAALVFSGGVNVVSVAFVLVVSNVVAAVVVARPLS